MSFLLDTNAVIAVLKGDAALHTKLKAHRPGDFAVSAIVAHELFYGAFESARTEAILDRVHALRFPVLEFDLEDAEAAGRIRAELGRKGQPIGPFDVLIAGQAMARNLTVVTNNVRAYARVKDLQIVDWQE